MVRQVGLEDLARDLVTEAKLEAYFFIVSMLETSEEAEVKVNSCIKYINDYYQIHAGGRGVSKYMAGREKVDR